jgi:hypothetical protein
MGVTLTPQEKARMGLDASSGSRPSGIVKFYACSVALPDGTICPAAYARYNASSHQFYFASPLCQKVYVAERLTGGIPAIESKAQELAPRAFRQAQAEERKQRRRKSLPMWERKLSSKQEADLPARIAARYAGQYAVCLRLSSAA